MVRYWLAIALSFSTISLHAQEKDTGFYLLRTGYVLEGVATLDGGHYIVQTQFGTMNVPAQSVEFVGKSRTDVYLHKRSGVDSTNYNALVRLAEWCISNGFIEEGIAEYQRANQIAPNAVFAGIVQQRLDTLRQIGAVDAAQELPIPQADIPADTSTGLSVSRLAFESFVRRVQPILVNRCISTDCHGTHSEQQFKLGVPQESMGSTSRRNLQAVLPYIDRDYPMESPILLALVTPHSRTRAALNVESSLYLQTVQWVQQVARELPPVQHRERISADSVRVSELPEQFRRAAPKAERPESSETMQKRVFDPLDPDVFNERYHRQTR